VVLEAPGMGDDVQSIKAGILEIADILVVNKADQPGVGRVVKSLEMMIHLGLERAPAGDHQPASPVVARALPDDGRLPPAGWTVPVLQTVATTGQGVEELAVALTRHAEYLRLSSGWAAREWARSREEIEQLVRDRFIDYLAAALPAAERASLVAAVAERRLDPYTAADRLFAGATAALGAPAS